MFGGEFHGNYVKNLQIDRSLTSPRLVQSTPTLDDSGMIKTVQWTLAELTPADSQLVFSVVTDTLNESKTLIGVMTLNCPPDYSTQNSAEVTLTVAPELVLSKYVDPPGPYRPGDSGVYHLTLRNDGQRDIDSLILSDNFSPDIFVDRDGIAPPPDSIVNNVIYWYVDTLRSKKSKEYIVPFLVDSSMQISASLSENLITSLKTS